MWFRLWSTYSGGTARKYRPMLGRPRRRSSITVSTANDPHPGSDARRHSRTDQEDEREIRYVHIFRGPSQHAPVADDVARCSGKRVIIILRFTHLSIYHRRFIQSPHSRRNHVAMNLVCMIMTKLSLGNHFCGNFCGNITRNIIIRYAITTVKHAQNLWNRTTNVFTRIKTI